MNGDLFKGIKQWDFDWQGTIAKLPVFYYDNTTMTAIHTASTSAVKKLLPDKAMRPIELYPGKSLVAFTAFEYRKTDIDPYNEFSISILCTLGEPQTPGVTCAMQFLQRKFTAYIWQLPVTTEIARIGGVDIYGYPKFIADIVFTRDSKGLVCELSENGKHILTLSGRKIPTSKGKLTRYITYSVKDGITLVANVYTDPLEFGQSPVPGNAELEIGSDHPIAHTLNSIGLSKAPLIYQYSPVNQAILFGGRNLIDN